MEGLKAELSLCAMRLRVHFFCIALLRLSMASEEAVANETEEVLRLDNIPPSTLVRFSLQS